MATIQAIGLSKSFAVKRKNQRFKVDAVRAIGLQVEDGEVFGFLGPNGAGKSTTVKMLTTLLAPDAGEVTVCGYDLRKQPNEVRKHTGYVSQAGGTDRWGTARENLILQARLYGIDAAKAGARAAALISTLDMEEFADRRASGYSGGQRRKLDLALGMVHQPWLLFLDEPTTGLDPVSRAQLWEQVRMLRANGTTVFLTTHYLDEADQLCDRVAIIDKGEIVAEGSPASLKRRLSGDVVTLRTQAVDHAVESASKILGRHPLIREVIAGENGSLRVMVNDGEEAVPEILKRLSANNIGVTAISLTRPSLDDVFLKLTGHSLSGPVASDQVKPAAAAATTN